ncbi:hypothetical protein ABT246_38065 [Streptomyces sp. NPDC001553]|uniref:hypothetical protein n=1 Tax=Streptomyces sp. NPDC001553 TaxID=3154385 RepID=UPI00332A1B44
MIQIPTFATWLETNPAHSFPNEETAWAVYNDRQHQSVEAFLLSPGALAAGGQVAVAEAAGTAFLESVFDSAWVRKKFPLADQREEFDPWMRQTRQRQELARRVYEFQTEPWYADFITYTRTNEVASVLFEADVLHTLMRMPAGITRVATSGVKGQDFDILMQMPNGDIPIEVKYKPDDKPYTPSAIRNIVKGAAEQLPKGKVGWLFMHIPTSWVHPGFDDEYTDVLSEVVRAATTRIGVVFTAIDKPSHMNDSGMTLHRRHWHYHRQPESASQELWEAALLLRNLLNNEMDFFAPHAPF